ncbi:phosphatidylglycerophosphatase A [Methanonatronarchaeum sp. AMET-Sl]|uniref:phosphatidylglycerophosphatase A n=1 Tax=Methanonatronarchaeum sp. AMET-Sl TaxID=3037654 RepID=UPI00244E327D|nr:phosphatidylglycerophosphatase A [Methanonatronarchaeum sp. AMET-Sl]WGI17419.1 phosphatidylglycerophosphatase A [Methanonatronarchaeum sp. AMET-Sl]
MDFNSFDDYFEVIGNFDVLSSAPLNGGFSECDRIVNMNVDGDDDKNEGRPIFETFLETLDLDKNELDRVVGFMTGADVTEFYVGSAEVDGNEVKVWITAGIGNSLNDKSNTINIILVTDCNLSPTAMANLFIVITEAKANALRHLEIMYNGDLITGTPTDAIAVAKDGAKGKSVEYAGVATPIGRTVYNLVEEGVIDALDKQEGYSINRSILNRLEENGITINDMANAAFELYEGGVPSKVDRSRFKSILRDKCSDENIKLLIESGIYLGRRSRIQNKGDPAYVVADELLGIDIAEYIAGKNGLFNFVRYDKQKPGILSELDEKDVFLDDVIGGLIAGCMTRLFEEKNRK